MSQAVRSPATSFPGAMAEGVRGAEYGLAASRVFSPRAIQDDIDRTGPGHNRPCPRRKTKGTGFGVSHRTDGIHTAPLCRCPREGQKLGGIASEDRW